MALFSADTGEMGRIGKMWLRVRALWMGREEGNTQADGLG